MGAERKVFPSDLYVQPPKDINGKQRVHFLIFTRQFPPEAFIQADVPFILQYLDLWLVMNEITAQLLELEGEYTTENHIGTVSAHPLFQIYRTISNELRTLANFLQVSPPARYQPELIEGGRNPADKTGRKVVRMVNNFVRAGAIRGPEMEPLGAA